MACYSKPASDVEENFAVLVVDMISILGCTERPAFEVPPNDKKELCRLLLQIFQAIFDITVPPWMLLGELLFLSARCLLKGIGDHS